MSTVINIHNYEEFFLLYADNELSATERKAVEAFVLANPDLAVELEMLQQVHLNDEEIVFAGKQALYRSESQEISLNNYEERFLLFVDEELSADEKDKVERFVLQHPEMQEQFTQLKQTKLPAEQFIFTDKASLYRKEKERRVLYMSWQRMAVAAAFIGAVALTWIALPKESSRPEAGLANAGNTGTEGVAASPAAKTAAPAGDGKQENSIAMENATANTSSENPAAKNFSQGVTYQNNGSSGNSVSEKVVEPSSPGNTGNANAMLVASNTGATVNQGDALTAKTQGATGETVNSDTHGGFSMVASNTTRLPDDHAAITAANTELTGGPNNNEVQPAVYRELDINAEDEKKSLLLGSIEINKDKLRGFFRKAGSLFRSKAKAEDEKTEGRPSSNTRSLK